MNKVFTVCAVLTAALVQSANASEISVLRCDLQYTFSNQAPFWTTVASGFSQPNKMSLPAVVNTKPENLGGSNPCWDSMVFCSRQNVSSQANGRVTVQVTTKRTMTVIDKLCSELGGDAISTQSETFGLGGMSAFDYRFYNLDGSSTQRRRVAYFADSSEFITFDSYIAQAKCDAIASTMTGF